MFAETSSGKYKARSVFTDLAPYSINLLQNTYAYRELLDHNRLLHGMGGARFFAKGHYTTGKEYIDPFNDALRLLMESCDHCQGFIINNSMTGGTGSGFGSLVLERLGVDYRKRCKIGCHLSFDALKPRQAMDVYNAMLFTSFSMSAGDPEASLIIDNNALYRICTNQLKIKTPRFRHYNALITNLICNVSAPWRFNMREDMSSFAQNMCPLPRLHFLMASVSSIHDPGNDNLQSMTDQCLENANFYHECDGFDVDKDRYMALAFSYRGHHMDQYMDAIYKSMDHLGEDGKISFVEWTASEPSVQFIEDDMKWGLPHQQVTMIGNNVCMQRMFMLLCKKYDVMYNTRCWVHWHAGEGAGGDLAVAREDIGSLMKDYMDACKTKNPMLSDSTEDDAEDV